MSKPTQTIYPAPLKPDIAAALEEKARWLLQTYGYDALNDVIVELFKPSDSCSFKPLAYQRLFRAWREKIVGPEGGDKGWDNATARWEADPARLNVGGVRMRPDQPFPVYAEDEEFFKNTYRRPQHAGSGVIKPWLDFMAHLLPDEAEREWFLDWLAHKHRYPNIPGVAVVMVAAGPLGPVYGCGRGMLRDILARLLGMKYVKPIDFDIFSGKSAQAAYTDWAAYAILVTVSEAKDTAEAGRWAERRATYERLKEIVDPRAVERTFLVKGFKAFTALAFASYLIFSNNLDALQIPEGDRRVAALANGLKMTPEMAQALQAWMDDPGNIAELARWLEARDIEAFDVYTPLVTKTKTTMQELARSELDDAFIAVRKLIDANALFTSDQIIRAVEEELGSARGEEYKNWVRRRIRSDAATLESFRMPRGVTGQRNKILYWRGADCSGVKSASHAQALVLATGKKIEAAREDPKPAGAGDKVVMMTGPQEPAAE
jgi:hypothetical protein